MSQLQLSARAYHRILKLVRTIADLAACENPKYAVSCLLPGGRQSDHFFFSFTPDKGRINRALGIGFDCTTRGKCGRAVRTLLRRSGRG